MTEDEARVQLERMVASATFPTLSATEITDLLGIGRRPDKYGIMDVGIARPDGVDRTASDGEYPVWAPTTVYALAVTVVPRVRSGRAYVVTTAGTSGAVDPVWPVSGTIADGTVVWTLTDVYVWQPTYDLNAAAAEGWRWKAARTADRVTFGSQGDNYNADQLYEHCLEMAKYYEGRTGPRTIRVGSPRIKTLDISRLPRA